MPPVPTALGVGFIGCGEATQAIHLPVLSLFRDDLRTVACMDTDPGVAAAVAERCGARSCSTLEEVLDDDAVDIVVICSPSDFHAEQVIASCAAGKKAVLCEKPLASTVEAAAALAEAVAATDVPVVVGTMHAFDPSWQALTAAWGDLPREAVFVRSTTFLPPNKALVAASTDLVRGESRGRPANPRSLPVELFVFDLLMKNLAIHHIPLVRAFLGDDLDAVTIDIAQPLGMAGYLVSLRTGEKLVQLVAHVHAHDETVWTLEAVSASSEAHVSFPPSYVLGGSATARLSDAAGSRVWGPLEENGYVTEWRHVLSVARSEQAPLRSLAEAVADVDLAERLAAAAPRPA